MLMAAAQKPSGAGFAWCNETRNTVMAALGFEEQGNVVTRGWYRVAPGQMPAAGPHRQAAAALQLRRGGRAGQPAAPRRRPAGGASGPAGRCGGFHGVLGRFHHPVHAQLQVRIERSPGLRRQRPHRHRLRHRGNVRRRRNDGAVQVKAALRAARGRCIRLAMTIAPNPPSPATRVRFGRNLGVRPRQHALSARPQSLAADRRPHPLVRFRISSA